MPIKIAAKYRPFSKVPGAKSVVPGTSFVIEGYPTHVKLWDYSLEPRLIDEKALPVKTPATSFLQILDLERGEVRIVVDQHTFSGFFDIPRKSPLPKERLFLGCSKKGDWESMVRRGQVEEFFPYWHRLGLMLPEVVPAIGEISHFFDSSQTYEDYQLLFRAGFSSILMPRLADESRFGLEKSTSSGSPLWLLQAGAKRIREMFLCKEGERLFVLPSRFPEFHAGRLVACEIAGLGEVDLEWSKKWVNKLVIRPQVSGSVVLALPSGVKRFRKSKEGWLEREAPVILEPGKEIYLDRFE